MHVCMIDEKTTQISKPPKRSRPKSSLRKRAPIESLLTSTGIASSFSSQEPRRPRFSFFHLHNFKELTSLPSRARTSLEALASTFFQGTGVSVRLPGRSSALSEIVEQWERLALGVVNVAGCSRDVFVCQHPIFIFRFIQICI
jgi:hypothetical protein